MEMTTSPTKRKRGRPRLVVTKRARRAHDRFAKVKKGLELTSEQQSVAYRAYAEHCDACLKLNITPTRFEEWARDYKYWSMEKLQSERWNRENRGDGLQLQKYDVYFAGIDNGREAR